VLGDDQTPGGRRYCQATEIVAGDVLRARAHGLTADGQSAVMSVEVSEDRGKDGILSAKLLERGVREHPADQCSFVARPENALYAMDDVDPILVGVLGWLACPV